MDRTEDRDRGDRGMDSGIEGKAALAFDSLDLIERVTRDGCPPRVLQDIVGNLLVLLAWLDDENGARRMRARATDARVRALIVDCLAKAGVPPHAIPDSLGLIRDCFGDDHLKAEIGLEPAAARPVATTETR